MKRLTFKQYFVLSLGTMRRLQIFILWLFKAKNNITFLELIRFCLKPTVFKLANRYISKIEPDGAFFRVTFKGVEMALYWPSAAAIRGIYQVTAETFDPSD